MSERVEKEGCEGELERSPSKPAKQKKGGASNRILAVALALAGVAVTLILSGQGLMPTRGHEIVLICGVACLCITIWRGVNVAVGVAASVVGTAVIIALFQMELLWPGNAPFAALALIVIVSALREFSRKR